jgi:hypothetical protein
MIHFVLDGFWLLGAIVVAYLLGVFTSQYAKDKLRGVPSEVRAALRNLEAKALATATATKNRAVTDAVSAITPPMPTVAKPVVAAAPFSNPQA